MADKKPYNGLLIPLLVLALITGLLILWEGVGAIKGSSWIISPPLNL
ncbi:hypothetical protein [Methanospirillum lacunae]|nr:hypothetical protein [Methanospirillum lacunae]